MELFYILIWIIILFFILLTIKNIGGKKNRIKKNFCVVCASISLTWVILLALYLINLFDNLLLISLLMGMSLTGIYYLLGRKIGRKNEKLKIFRLPLILTLIILAYFILTLENIINSIFIVAGLWALFILIYIYNNSKLIEKLLECCKE